MADLIASPPPGQTITIFGEALAVIDRPIHAHWREAAARKGFAIIARVADRYHLALRCEACGGAVKAKLFVLMRSRPLCRHCLESRWRAEAEAAGIAFLRRDPDDTAYGFYRLPCGHQGRRQFELVSRAALGASGLRCAICHRATEEAEAAACGWQLIGPDPLDDANYRLYRHGRCGHEQRVARVNMQTRRFDCAACGSSWTAAPSFLYLFRIRLAGGALVVKLGYASDPDSRLHHQLLRDRSLAARELRRVAMPSGQAAILAEKALHAGLRRDFPQAVLAPEAFAEALSVKSEVYADWLAPEICARLAAVEAGLASGGDDAGDEAGSAADDAAEAGNAAGGHEGRGGRPCAEAAS